MTLIIISTILFIIAFVLLVSGLLLMICKDHITDLDVPIIMSCFVFSYLILWGLTLNFLVSFPYV